MHPSHYSRIKRAALAVASIAVVSSSLSAAGPAAKDDFFRKRELSSDVALSGRQFYIPTVFGPTGMNGWMLDETLVVREVENGSPADGIMAPNDIISHVNGKPLGAEPLKTFGRQIEVS
ncbi:MAG: hypothetical protein GY953_40680, partial [bacterium]|nr:hypothetical protein [bacterium]